MTLLFVFALALFFSSLGVLPPGMLNMTAAIISIKQSHFHAKKFIKGVLIVVALQSFLGYYFATFLEQNPHVMRNLKLVGISIFSILTLFFLGKGIQSVMHAHKIDTPTKISKLPPFSHGLLLSAINVFPLPYYAFLSLYFSAFIPSFFTISIGFAFILGSVLGTGVVYHIYAYFFKKFENKMTFFSNNINFIIAIITGMVAILTFYTLK